MVNIGDRVEITQTVFTDEGIRRGQFGIVRSVKEDGTILTEAEVVNPGSYEGATWTFYKGEYKVVKTTVYVVFKEIGDNCTWPKAVFSSYEKAQEWITGLNEDYWEIDSYVVDDPR